MSFFDEELEELEEWLKRDYTTSTWLLEDEESSECSDMDFSINTHSISVNTHDSLLDLPVYTVHCN